jgi:hypothetical protein
MTTLHTLTVHLDLPDGTPYLDAETHVAQAIANYYHDVLRAPTNVTVINTWTDPGASVCDLNSTTSMRKAVVRE